MEGSTNCAKNCLQRASSERREEKNGRRYLVHGKGTEGPADPGSPSELLPEQPELLPEQPEQPELLPEQLELLLGHPNHHPGQPDSELPEQP